MGAFYSKLRAGIELGTNSSIFELSATVEMEIRDNDERQQQHHRTEWAKKHIFCTICRQAYRPPIKQLRCGHSFCYQCLVEKRAASGERKMITCPNCTKETGCWYGLRSLGRNVDLERLATELNVIGPSYENVVSDSTWSVVSSTASRPINAEAYEIISFISSSSGVYADMPSSSEEYADMPSVSVSSGASAIVTMDRSVAFIGTVMADPSSIGDTDLITVAQPSLIGIPDVIANETESMAETDESGTTNSDFRSVTV